MGILYSVFCIACRMEADSTPKLELDSLAQTGCAEAAILRLDVVGLDEKFCGVSVDDCYLLIVVKLLWE